MCGRAYTGLFALTQVGDRPQSKTHASELAHVTSLREGLAMSDAKRQIIATSAAPAAIGPYSQGVVSQGTRTFYSSGQIALDPVAGTMVGDDVRTQAEQVMKNLDAVLRAARMDFSNVVRATIYLVDMAEFSAVNTVYSARFSDSPPARACVQAAALPKGALVEIDVIAVD